MQRWGRARRKTERLIDFDGSSAAPRRDHTYSCQPTSCQLPARFYDYSCSSVADETFTRHKRPAPQICPPPVVVSDNSFHSTLFVPLYHLSRARSLAISLRIYIYLAAKMCEEYSSAPKRETKFTVIFVLEVTSSLPALRFFFPYRYLGEQRSPKYRFLSGLRAIAWM